MFTFKGNIQCSKEGITSGVSHGMRWRRELRLCLLECPYGDKYRGFNKIWSRQLRVRERVKKSNRLYEQGAVRPLNQGGLGGCSTENLELWKLWNAISRILGTKLSRKHVWKLLCLHGHPMLNKCKKKPFILQNGQNVRGVSVSSSSTFIFPSICLFSVPALSGKERY